MGLIVSQFRRGLRADSGGPPGPTSDYWFTPFDLTGVTPEKAMQLSTVFSCVRVASETMGSLPAIIYRRLPNDGKERALDHPLYKLLRYKPNPWQTSFEFFEMMQGHLELRGNAYAVIQPGPNGPVSALIPLHPDRVTVKRMPSGEIRYEVNSATGPIQKYLQDEILHLRGLSSDGITGMSPISASKECVAKGLEQQSFASRSLKNDDTPPGVIKHPGRMKDDAFNKFRRSWREYQAGKNRGMTAILEDGMEYQAIGVSNRDSQLLEASQATREEICGIYRMPPHKVGILTRATNNNIEHQGIEFSTDTMGPRVIRVEQRLNADLIEPLGIPGEYFVEFLMDATMRGDLQSRYGAYATGRQWGWLSVNDVRKRENMNPIDDGDEYLVPVNMAPAGTLPAAPAPGTKPADPNSEDDAAIARRLGVKLPL